MLILPLEGNVDDSPRSFAYAVKQLAPLAIAQDQVEIDLSKLNFLGPDGVSLLVGSILMARRRGATVEYEAPLSPKLLAFMEFSGFNHFVLGGSPPDPLHPDNVTVPIRKLDASRHEDAEPIFRLVQAYKPVSQAVREALGIAFSECVQNIADHAESPIGGICCARYFSERHEVRVSLVDFGLGILTTLRRRFPDTKDDRQALERVLAGDYSAQSRPANAGRGINNLQMCVTQALTGQFFIATGNTVVSIRSGHQPSFIPLQTAFLGTAVCFTLPV